MGEAKRRKVVESGPGRNVWDRRVPDWEERRNFFIVLSHNNTLSDQAHFCGILSLLNLEEVLSPCQHIPTDRPVPECRLIGIDARGSHFGITVDHKIDHREVLHAVPLLSAPALKSSLAPASPLLTLTTVLRTFELANEPSHLLMPVGQLPHRRKELFTILAAYDWK